MNVYIHITIRLTIFYDTGFHRPSVVVTFRRYAQAPRGKWRAGCEWGHADARSAHENFSSGGTAAAAGRRRRLCCHRCCRRHHCGILLHVGDWRARTARRGRDVKTHGDCIILFSVARGRIMFQTTIWIIRNCTYLYIVHRNAAEKHRKTESF